MTIIEKTENLIISHADIDQDHDDFIKLINEMENTTPEKFTPLFSALIEHTEAHFSRENKLMEMYDFPAINEHQGEHHRVLTELNRFKKQLDKGMFAMVQAYITELVPQWFVLHVTTMDSALDAHIKRMSKQV